MEQDGHWIELTVWMTSCPEEMSWEFEDFEKTELRSTVEGSVEFFWSLQAEILNTTWYVSHGGGSA